MERLLNLLQEFYWENRKFSNDDWLLTMTNWVENLSGAYAQTYIISLKGGFVKWLVENDKIDTRKVAEKREEDWWSIVNYNHDEETKTIETMIEYWTDNTLMALSTSNSPIEDIILYLK